MARTVPWSYHIHVASVARPPSEDLNRLGAEGWELISAVGVGELGAVDEIWYVFKRPREPPTRASSD